MKTYDVPVIGGGSAGTSAAAAAHQAGAKTAMFNEGELGGLCILRGCMPTKTMLHAAHLVHEPQHHHTPGISPAAPEIDFAAVMANTAAKVARFKKAKLAGIAAGGYEVIDARAQFSGPDTIEAGGETYRFTRGAVLASGSVPSLPPIPGIDKIDVWTSDTVMKLESIPESAIVMGGGAIGLELGLFLARMGTRVIQANRSRFFSKIDEELALQMKGVLDAEPNLTAVAPFDAQRIEQRDGQVHLHVEAEDGPRTLSAQHFVAATGRDAHLEGLGLEAAGIEALRGRVTHDEAMKTTNPRIFVAGDATGNELLLHVANWEGRSAGRGAAEVPGNHAVERRLAMTAIFTDPPLATIGLSEREAQQAGIPCVTASAELASTGRCITMDVQHGLWKLVAHEHTGEILGSQILGPRADDIVHTISAVMYYRGTARDLLEMPWYHPTITEVGLSLARGIVAQLKPV